ncbi:TetR/AcrR family transcriptional regulator [Alkalibacter rhizosphaerae]|uniref:TetR/AcrR family transcriptional regulator n=1 Tax=Alkalibacter rhizosphaerae TaxID=2815577 RepID=A0A975AJG1_9FIRM|nr:TetR family transcriptional regulator [Alkalibacter rhizosphaerae]QSX09580.1 TetR/AcrR family transcriptional regulator [Alkalibacter rhizosphaerae]
MAVYKTGEKSKNSILEACKELFYTQGYKGTTYKDICEKANSNPGLINYYFKTKKKISEIIYGDFYMDIKTKVEEYITRHHGDYDLQVGTCVEILVVNKLMEKDSNLQRFYYDLSLEGVEYDMKVFYYFYKLHVDRYNLPLSDEQIRLIWVANTSIGIGISKKYMEGFFDIPPLELYEFRIKTMYNSMGIDNKRIEEVIAKAYEISDDMEVTLHDFFEIELHRNNLK